MKRFLKFTLCIVAIMAIVLFPETFEFLSPSNDTLCFAVGPAFAALNWPVGRNNMAGYKDRILFIPGASVKKAPLVPNDPKNNEEIGVAVGTFEFKATGDKPIYIYCTKNTVKYGAESQGETDGISFAEKGEFFFPGNNKDMHAFNALVKNTPGYLVLEDTDDAQILVGQPGLLASIKPSFDGGQSRADRRGTKYEFEADSNYTAIFLASPIDFDTLEAKEVGG